MALNLDPDIRCSDVRHNGDITNRPKAVAALRRAANDDNRLLPRCDQCIRWYRSSDHVFDAVALVPLRVRRRADQHDRRTDDYDRTAAAVKRTFTEPPDLITHHP